ncbi:MAG: tRNA-dihydrouridine synthase family protein, partial [Myxococcota bacterium]
MPFRRLVLHCSGTSAVGQVTTEFIAIERLNRATLQAHKQLQFSPEERPIAVQIFGAERDAMLNAATIVQEAGADILDLNCGCPAPKVVRRGGGAGLLRTLDTLHRLLRDMVAQVDIPVTVKIRSGWSPDHVVAPEVLQLATDAGVQMVAVHGRTRTQLYRGEPDWAIVAQLAQNATIPVVGSGDVACWQDAERRLRETGCAGLMIGRAAIKNPWIFRQIDAMRRGLSPTPPTLHEVASALAIYLKELRAYHSERWVKARMKRMSAAMVHGYPGS